MQVLRCLEDLSGVSVLHKFNTAVVDAGRQRTLPTPTNQYVTIASVAGDPWSRSRDIAGGLAPPQPRLLDVLRDDQFPSIPLLAEGTPVSRYHPVRMQFCQFLRHQHAADELFVHAIQWTGECFMREGLFNVHNSHI
jgi:hypothetical protein